MKEIHDFQILNRGSTGRKDDKYYRQFGGLWEDRHAVTVDLQFRLATNGVIVNTLVNDTPVITTSAAQFHN